MALLPAIFFCLVLIAEPCGVFSVSGYGDGWQDGGYQRRVPRDVMVNVINDLGLSLLEVHNEHNENNIAISPYGATSVLVALVEGLTGDAAHEIRYAIHLPQELSIVRIGLRDIHRHLKSYFIPKEGFLAGLTLSHENITLNREYESILRFYGYDVDSFNNPVYPEAFSTPPPTTTKTARTTTLAMDTTTEPMSTTEEIARMETDETSTENLSSLKPERTTRKENSLPDLEKEGFGTTKNVPVRETTKMDTDSTEDIALSETRYTTPSVAYEYTVTTEMSTIRDVTDEDIARTTEQLIITTSADAGEDITAPDIESTMEQLSGFTVTTESITNKDITTRALDDIESTTENLFSTTITNSKTTNNFITTESNTEKNLSTVADSTKVSTATTITTTLDDTESMTEKLFSTAITTVENSKTTNNFITTEATTEKIFSTIAVSTTTAEEIGTTDFPAAAMLGMVSTSPLIATLATSQDVKETAVEKQDEGNSKESGNSADALDKTDSNSGTKEESEVTEVSGTDGTIEEFTSSTMVKETTTQFTTSITEELRPSSKETTTEIMFSKTTDGRLETTEELMSGMEAENTEKLMDDVGKEATEAFTSGVGTETTDGIQSENTRFSNKDAATTSIDDMFTESSIDETTSTSDPTTSTTNEAVRKRRHVELTSKAIKSKDISKSENDSSFEKYNKLGVSFVPIENGESLKLHEFKGNDLEATIEIANLKKMELIDAKNDTTFTSNTKYNEFEFLKMSTTSSTDDIFPESESINDSRTRINTSEGFTTSSDDSNGIFQISANITTQKRHRSKRSVIDYLIARYYDNYHISSNRRYLPPPKPHYSNYQPEVPYTFLVNGKYRESNISFMTYDTVLPFHYIPGLDAMALSFPLDSNMYYLLLVLPVDEQGIDKLINDFKKVTTLEYIVQNLKYTHVKAVIPSFTLKGYVVLTPSLQKLCIRKIFEPRHADFSQLTPEKDIYVTNIEQAVTVTIRNYMDPSSGSGRNLQAYRPVEFKADHPFLYFVMDAQIHVNLMAGKITNPLNSRIR